MSALGSMAVFITGLIFGIILLSLPILGIVYLVLALWNPQRMRGRVCSRCGYDLAGIPPRVLCPECGAPRPRAALERLSRNTPRPVLAVIGVVLLMEGCLGLYWLLQMGGS